VLQKVLQSLSKREAMETFGEWLRGQRGARKLTREEFAKRVGCSVALLRKIEDGERRPSTQIADLLANCLDVPPEQRSIFVRVARGELSLDRLASELKPVANLNISSPKTNLPIFPSPLIGREHELEQLGQLLCDPECRLLTLVGPGGIGKTRLAVEMASRGHDAFVNGTYFVSLAAVNSTTFVIPMIAEALGFTFQGPGSTDPKTQLFSYLKEKDVLLLLDNLEHLLSGPGIEVLSELIANAPQVKLLVTSRESLELQGEWVFQVHGLPIPETGITQGTSVELFLQRARRADVEFEAATDDYPAILQICRLVDGMPLGLELAAAWVRALSCAEIAVEIERGLDFLKNSARDLPERHRSMRAVFDHSWKLLSDEEQSVLARLSVFQGGFSLEAAEQIASATVFTLSNLVTKSLIRRSGKEQYDLHELLHQYAKSRAQTDYDDYETIEGRHSAYYLNFVRSLEQPLIGPEQVSARTEFVANMENIRPAWDYAVRHDQVDVMKGSINSFWNFFESHTWYHEGVAIFGLAADEIQRVCGDVSQMDTAHLILYEYLRCCQGWCCLHVGKFQEARNMLTEGVQTLRSKGALAELSRSLHYFGVIYWLAGEYTKALELFHEKRVLDLPEGNSWNLGLAYGNLGMVTETMGFLEESRDHFQKAISISRAGGDLRLLGIGLFYLGSVKNKLGLIEEGKAHLYESLEISRSIGDRFGMSMASNSLGLVLQKEKNPVEAQHMFQESLKVSTEMGEKWILQQSLVNLGFAKFALSEVAEARDCFLRALRLASETNLIPPILDSLAGMAWIYAGQGKEELAMDLVIQVEKHPAVTQDTKARAEALRLKLETQLTPTQIQMAQARASEKSFESVVGELLR
jgi:predicted ATPase/DNA-binding XRE family transcriptional regulator